jgi:hypothetical protein
MKKSDFRVIIGGADISANNGGREFISAFVTESRLMGVLVLYFHWRIAGENAFHQYFYIEVTEIGIEAYRSIAGDDSAEITEIEQAMLGGLGSAKVELTERQAKLLLQSYAAFNEKFNEPLPEGRGEYAFILNEELDAGQEELTNLFRKTCVKLDTDNELINYFLMRYFAGDDEAARYLVRFHFSEENSPDNNDATLCMNKITLDRTVEGIPTYICESVLEGEDFHSIVVSEVSVERGKVSAFKIISDFPISNAEAAMKLERSEFVTVFDLMMDVESVKVFLEDRYLGAMKRDTEMGRLYLEFTENNEHLRKDLYQLNDDVHGMIYITDEGQLILAAYTLPQMRRLEKHIHMLPFGQRLIQLARYEFKEDLFYDFVRSDSGDFIKYLEEIYEFDD